jgi:DNA polymerase IV
MMDQEVQNRKIVHIDLDSFYASVEQRDNPALRGKPVVVGGDPYGRGVVATASYEARAFGIHSAQSCRVALRLCPEAIFLRPRFDLYREISKEIQTIYRQCTPLVEPLALDEAYLDVTDVVGVGSATQVARNLKQEIFSRTGLTASAGVSYNKFLAKVASAHRKPNGLTVVTQETAPTFIDALPVGKIFGVGEVTEARLRELGIETGKDLKQLSLERLQKLFGKRGAILHSFVRGIDLRPVDVERERKSVGKETTFEHDMGDRDEMLAIVETLAEQVALRLAELGIAGKTITLKLRWNDFRNVSRSISPSQPIQSAGAMMRYLRPLLEQLLQERKPVRLLGVTLSHLVAEAEMNKYKQMSMQTLWDLAGE